MSRLLSLQQRAHLIHNTAHVSASLDAFDVRFQACSGRGVSNILTKYI